jgi:hypothetical protein
MSDLQGPFFKNIIDYMTKEINKTETKEKINKYILSPILLEAYNKVNKLIFVHFIIQLIILVFVVIIFIRSNK